MSFILVRVSWIDTHCDIARRKLARNVRTVEMKIGIVRISIFVLVSMLTFETMPQEIFAEELKIKYACALAQLASAEETIEVPSVGDRPARRLARLKSCVLNTFR